MTPSKASPTVILPGYLAGSQPYQEMEAALESLAIPAYTVPLKRRDWLPTIGGRSMLPILRQLDQTIKQVLSDTGSDRVNLVGHSAGGWIARIYLGEAPYDIHPGDAEKPCSWKGAKSVQTLVTLGTPHVSQERWTKRNLDFVKTHCPLNTDIDYICVAGKSVHGKHRFANWFAHSSYELTIGQGNCWGDGIIPIAAAHLEGAKNLTLDSVLHSPRPGKLWYGSGAIVPMWATYLHK